MKAKTTTDTQSVKTITEHMVNVHVPCRGQQYHFQIVVTVADGVCEVESDRIYIVGNVVAAINADTLSAIAEKAAIKHVKEWLKTKKEGKVFNAHLGLSRQVVRDDGYDDQALTDTEMLEIAQDVGNSDAVIDAYHDALAELLDAKGVAHLPDSEWQF